MKAFLSHASADNLLAKRIFNYLRDQPVAVWFDRLELRPGDLLLDSIVSGIDSADYLIALITVNSIGSPWVQKELEIALNSETTAGKPIVVPLLVAPCPPPTLLENRLYLTIDDHQTEFPDIVPALFRTSFILDITLNAALQVDRKNLLTDLYDLMRSTLPSLRVRIYNNGFNRKIIEIVGYTITSLMEKGGQEGFVQQVQEASRMYDIQLPLFWTSLADFIMHFCEVVFEQLGKNLGAVDIALTGIANTVDLAMSKLAAKLRVAIFSVFSNELGYGDTAAWIAAASMKDNAEFWDSDTHWNESVTRLAGLRFSRSLQEVELEGAAGIRRTRCFAPIHEPKLLLWRPRPEIELMPSVWFELCVPQIIARELAIVAFYEGKPFHELGYKVGLRLNDYVAMGLA